MYTGPGGRAYTGQVAVCTRALKVECILAREEGYTPVPEGVFTLVQVVGSTWGLAGAYTQAREVASIVVPAAVCI